MIIRRGLIKWKQINKISISIAIANSLYHAQHYIPNFSETKFLDFIKDDILDLMGPGIEPNTSLNQRFLRFLMIYAPLMLIQHFSKFHR